MKKTIIILLSLISLQLSATIYYCSPDGVDGDYPIRGTFANPWRTWHYAFNNVTSSDTVYFRGGTYLPYSNSIGVQIHSTVVDGTRDQPTCFFAYPGETPVLDCQIMNQQLNYGVYIAGAGNLYFKGLEVKNVRQIGGYGLPAGWLITHFLGDPSKNIRFENCVTHHCGRSGWHTYGVDSIYFYNCDSYMNCDSLTAYDPGGSGNGWFVENHSKDGYVHFYGCRAWNCSDQGWAYASIAEVVFENCWSIANGNIKIGQKKGSGWKIWIYQNSWKNTSVVQLTMKNCIAAYNNLGGINFTNAEHKIRCHIYNNLSYNNGLFHKQEIIPGIDYNPEWDSPKMAWGHGIYDPLIADTVGNWDHKYYNNVSYKNAGYIGWGPHGDVLTGITVESNNYFDYNNSPVVDNWFVSLDTMGMCGPRKEDWSLPDTDFGRPAFGSPLIDAGRDVGLPYTGNAPDIGWAEYDSGFQSSAKNIISFTLPQQTGSATINTNTYTVSIEVAHGTNVSLLTPTISVSAGATISPTSGVTRDFSTPQTYTVTAEDLSTQTWTVTVTVAEGEEPEPSEGKWVPVMKNGEFVIRNNRIVVKYIEDGN